MTSQPGETTRRWVGAGVATGLVLLAGLYLILSPWVVASTGQFGLAASNTITGLALALLAVGFARARDPLRGVAWVVPFIGGWVIGSPWAIYRKSMFVPFEFSGASLSTAAWLNNVIVGGVVVLAGIALTWFAVRAHNRT